MATEDITLRILTETQKANADIKKFSQQSSKELSKVNENLSALRLASINVFAQLSSKAIIAGFEAIAGAAESLYQTFIVDGINAAKEQEDALQDLNVALAQTGKYSKETSDDMLAFASSLQQTSRVGDETILQTAALIQNLGRLDTEGLKTATQAAVDLSAALKIDLNTAATLVGKAAVGEIGTFSRYGIVIKQGATEAETFANVLDKINKQFGGSAQAQLKTYGGATAQLANTFSDLQEETGAIVTRSQAAINVIKIFNDILLDLQKVVIANRASIREFALESLALTVDSFAYTIKLTGDLVKIFSLLSINTKILYLEMERAGKISLILLEKLYNFLDLQEVFNAVSTSAKFFVDFIIDSLAFLKDRIIESINAFIELINIIVDVTGVGVAVNKIADAFYNVKTAADESFKDRRKQLDEELKIASERKNSLQEVAGEFIKFSDLIRAESKNTADTQIEAQNRVLEAERLTSQQRALLIIEEQAATVERNEKEIEDRLKQIELVQNIESNSEKEKLEAKLSAINTLLALEEDNAQKTILIKQKQAAVLKKINDEQRKQELKDQQAFLSTAASLANSQNRTLAAIGKAAAITQIAIKTPEAVASSFAFGSRIGGPPLGFVFGAIAATAMAAQAAQVAGIPLQTGLTEVPQGFPNDSFQARLTSGERVVNVQQNKDLTDFLESQSDDVGEDQSSVVERLDIAIELLANVASNISNLENQFVVNIGNKEIINEVRDGLRAGRSIAV